MLHSNTENTQHLSKLSMNVNILRRKTDVHSPEHSNALARFIVVLAATFMCIM